LLIIFYRCQQSWQNRTQSPMLSRLNLDEFYYGIQQKYNQTGAITGVDVDIFTLGVQDESHIDEMEDLVFKLRQTANAKELLPSTGHNLIRILHQHGRTDDLVRILHDRLNYGIFADHHVSNMIMSDFMKAEKFQEAAKVGVLHGLQEDSSDQITNNLVLLACLQNVLKELSWELPTPPKVEEPKEEVKIRVKFLRNPYFDGHFDLIKGTPLMGKTMGILAPALENRTLSYSLELLGWAMLENWQKLESRIKVAKDPVLKDALELIQKQISKCKESKESEFPNSAEEVLKSLKIVDGNLFELMESSVKEAVSKFEAKAIQDNEKRYEQWEEQRQLLLSKQLRENEIKQKTKEIEEKRKYLQEKEQLLTFFENEDKYDLMIEKLEEEEEKRKLESRQEVTTETDIYVPPEVEKRHGSKTN